MALMEKNSRKRQRLESLENWRSQSNCMESEENPSKRLYEHSNSGNVDVFSDIMSQKVGCLQAGSTHEELVSNMMKELEEEIVSRSLNEEGSVNQWGSDQMCDIRGDNGDEAESASRDNQTNLEWEYNIFDGDFENLLLTCHEMDNVEYFQDYGFFECLEMERDAQHQLFLQKWLCGNDSEGRALISFDDYSSFLN